MTTPRQAASNRENAQKSTGPKSAAGKFRSGQNAVRHGLRARPDADQVLAWYRLILDNPEAQIDDFLLDAGHRAALTLAEAEVRLSNIRREEERLFLKAAGKRKTTPPKAHLILRYRREAEAHRASALEQWIDLQAE